MKFLISMNDLLKNNTFFWGLIISYIIFLISYYIDVEITIINYINFKHLLLNHMISPDTIIFNYDNISKYFILEDGLKDLFYQFNNDIEMNVISNNPNNDIEMNSLPNGINSVGDNDNITPNTSRFSHTSSEIAEMEQNKRIRKYKNILCFSMFGLTTPIVFIIKIFIK